MVLIDMNHEDGDYVLPGEILCSYEEYAPSDWTYVEEGYVKSNKQGRLVIDDYNKTVSIDSKDAPRHIQVNDLIIGYVTEVRTQKALITIKQIVGQKRELVAGYKGYIHISQAIGDYVQSMHYLYKIGDIVEAKVINVFTTEYIELSTASKRLGVIKAMCTNCRSFMELDKNNELTCECGKKDYRKLSQNYGGYLL